MSEAFCIKCCGVRDTNEVHHSWGTEWICRKCGSVVDTLHSDIDEEPHYESERPKKGGAA
jgi:transcription initiation factor TFIIIB Brf1 subunit/transcription initiation factor TFIIB